MQHHSFLPKEADKNIFVSAVSEGVQPATARFLATSIHLLKEGTIVQELARINFVTDNTVWFHLKRLEKTGHVCRVKRNRIVTWCSLEKPVVQYGTDDVFIDAILSNMGERTARFLKCNEDMLCIYGGNTALALAQNSGITTAAAAIHLKRASIKGYVIRVSRRCWIAGEALLKLKSMNYHPCNI